MHKGVSGKLEMAARVRQFCRAHPSDDPSYATAFGRFEDRLTRADAIVARQYNGRVSAKAARARRMELRRSVQFHLLRYLISVGGIAGRSNAELAERFRLPDTRANNRAFLTAVRAMVTLAEAHKDALVAEGMSPGLLEELGAKLAEFETVSDAARTARLDHIGARADLDEVAMDLVEAVRVLDGIYRWRYGGKNPELLVEWNAAKRVPGQGVRSEPIPEVPVPKVEVPPSSGGAETVA